MHCFNNAIQANVLKLDRTYGLTTISLFYIIHLREEGETPSLPPQRYIHFV